MRWRRSSILFCSGSSSMDKALLSRTDSLSRALSLKAPGCCRPTWSLPRCLYGSYAPWSY
eukprot:Gb_10710 [translate_table: standard]